MANRNLDFGEVYDFAVIGGQPTVIDSTDNVQGVKRLRQGLQVTGSISASGDIIAGYPNYSGVYGTPDGNDIAADGMIFQEGSGGIIGYKLQIGDNNLDMAPSNEGEAAFNGLVRMGRALWIGTSANDGSHTYSERYPLSLSANDSDQVYMYFNNSSTGYGNQQGYLMGLNSSEHMIFYHREEDKIYAFYNTDGGSTNETVRITQTGNLHAKSDVIAYSSTVSDIRLKTNIRPLTSSLATICKLEGIKYDWKYRDDPDHLGLIAQQVEKHIPEVIHETQLPGYVSGSRTYCEDSDTWTEHWDEKEYKVVRYEELVPHLIESIKELKSEIDELKLKLENK